MRDHVRFYLNGQPQTVRGALAFGTLTEYLREQRGLAGTKIVCAEGDCGACTVLVGRPGHGTLRYLTVDSCIQFLAQLDGCHVVTVEGLSCNGTPHPVQQAMVDCHGSQCGYCTPGFVMALAGWVESGAKADLKLALTGNLCRCTGYLPILDAGRKAAKECTSKVSERDTEAMRADLAHLAAQAVKVEANGRVFFAPTTLAEAIAFKASHPEAVVVSGATELGVLRNKRGIEPSAMLSLARVHALDEFQIEDGTATMGANVTWSKIEAELLPYLPVFGPIVRRFGSPQIRNVATLAGNIVNGSPIADSLPLLMVLDAELEIAGPHGTRRRPLNGFYTGYKKKDLAPDELLTRVILPLPPMGDRVRLYKVSRRTDLDIATVGAAISIVELGGTIREARVAFSGVAATVVRMPKAEAALTGRAFDEDAFRHAGRIARSEVTPMTDVRGSKDYRGQLVENLMVKFFFEEADLVSV